MTKRKVCGFGPYCCRENFLHLDVFMQELSYEEIIQQEAYDIPRLLGTTALFALALPGTN